MLGLVLPQAYICVLFWLIAPKLVTKLETACPLYSSSDHHLASKDNSSSGRHDLVEWVRQNGCPGSAAPAHHAVLRLGVILPELPHTHAPNTAAHSIREQPASANRTFRSCRTRLSTRRVRAAASSMPRATWCTRALSPAELTREATSAAAAFSGPCCILRACL